MSKSKNYTDKQFIEAVETSTSIRQVLFKLGLKEAGGNYEVAKSRMSSLGVKLLSGPNGQGWSKGKTLGPKRPIEDYLKEDVRVQSFRLKNRLLAEGLKQHKCECCGITEWNGKPAPIELDHINGNHHDNRLENLRILCPNCHAQTETYRGKNKKTSQRGKRKTDEEFLTAYEETSNIRQALIALGLAPKGANYDRMKRLLEGV